MAVSQAASLREAIMKTLPTTVKAPKTDSVDDTISIGGPFWDLEAPAKATKPTIVARVSVRTPIAPVIDGYKQQIEVVEQISNESHTFLTGQASTPVDEKDIDDVLSVTGTAGGNPRTFVENTDYQAADTDDDNALDAISWLAGGTKPDNNTAVLITYTHKLLEDQKRKLLRAEVLLKCLASPLASGERGATRAYKATEIQEAMEKALLTWYEKDLRPECEARGITLEEELTPRAPIKLGGTMGLLEQTIAFECQYQEEIQLSRVRMARKITTTVDVNTVDTQ